MAKFFRYFTVVLIVAYAFCAAAEIPDKEKYDKYFTVDLSAELPDYNELFEAYKNKYTTYDRKYKWHWDIGNVFDEVFRSTINTYGGTEKRVKAINEDALLKSIQLLPPQYYQYIGPFLHTVPGISEKILNLPGIKETKNKFPSRIAPQVENIKDIEYLSPYLYFLLMPEAWPGNPDTLEYPEEKKTTVRVMPSKDFYEKVNQMVPFEAFGAGENDSLTKAGERNLRTINITKTSPLTSGDIKAFARTLGALNELKSDIRVMARLYSAGTLLDYWEKEQGLGLPINGFKDFIYPCSRLVQKMRLAGEEAYLKTILAKNGFTPEEWAYTCDKTIKAFRILEATPSSAYAVKFHRSGYYNEHIKR